MTSSDAFAPAVWKGTITQAELRQFVELRRMVRAMVVMREELLARLEAGVRVQPGPLSATIVRGTTQRLTHAKLTELIGADLVAEFRAHVAPTEFCRLDVR